MASDLNIVKTSMRSIGETLRSAREKKAVTIDQVQKQTHIYSTVLIALEEGRCDEILPPTYVKSFLKKYAAYLGLDLNDILKEYSLIHKEEPVRSTIDINRVEIKNSFALPRFIRAGRPVLIFAVVLFLAASLGPKAARLFKARHRQLDRTRNKSLPSALKDKSSKHLTKAMASQNLEIPNKTPLKLVMKVKGNVLVKVKRDGVSLFESVLTKGVSEIITAESRINLYVAKLEALELTLNGKPLGPLGKGVVKDMEITRNGVKIK